MNSRKWTKKEVRILRRFYQTVSKANLAQMLNRPITGINRKLNRMGLSWKNAFHKNKIVRSKSCKICGVDKKIIRDNFYVQSVAKDGFMNVCKDCYNKKYFSTPKNPKKSIKVDVDKPIKVVMESPKQETKTVLNKVWRAPVTESKNDLLTKRLILKEHLTKSVSEFLKVYSIKADFFTVQETIQQFSEKILDVAKS
jgi:hypothetical protein